MHLHDYCLYCAFKNYDLTFISLPNNTWLIEEWNEEKLGKQIPQNSVDIALKNFFLKVIDWYNRKNQCNHNRKEEYSNRDGTTKLCLDCGAMFCG